MACDAIFYDVTIKVELDAACDETEARDSLSSHCTDERVTVKQEPADLAASTSCEPVEEMYAGHEVKEEMVIDSELLQPPDADEPLVCDDYVDFEDTTKQIKAEDDATCKIEISLEPIDIQLNNRDCDGRINTKTIKEKYKTISQPMPQPSCEPYNQYVPTATNSTRHNLVTDTSLSSDVLSNTATLTCDTCKKEHVIDYSLMQHQKQHAVKCCGIFINRKSIQTGQHQHIAKKLFSCDICKRQFTYKSRLIMHLRVHIGEKPFSCEICKWQFTDKSNLIRHQRVHTGEKPFSCDVCKRQFTGKSNLIRHQRLVHSEDKPFPCDVCEKQFTDKSSLNRHQQQVHTGEKPFSCDLCKKQYTNKSNLIIHQRVHTGEKPFACEVCKKQYTNKSNLTIHRRVHTGEKPYSCDVCQKQFTNKTNLIVHRRVHTGEKPFSCDVCRKEFPRKWNLKLHQQIHNQ